MDRKTLMADVEKRAFAARITLYKLCEDTGLSGTIASRWTRGGGTPSLATIGRLEQKLTEMERNRAD